MKTVFLCFVLLLVWQTSAQAFGVALASPTTTTAFSCLIDQGNSILIVRVYKANDTYKGIDKSGFQTLINAAAAKSRPSTVSSVGRPIVHVYMEPCRNNSDPIQQVREMLLNTPSRSFNTLYVKVQPSYHPGCTWETFTHQENCDYLTQLLRQIKQQSLIIYRRDTNVGVFSTANIWAAFFGNSCDTVGATYPSLWYANYESDGHVNPTQTFNDFIPFGGWTAPVLKQIAGNTTAYKLCGNEWQVFLDRVWTMYHI